MYQAFSLETSVLSITSWGCSVNNSRGCDLLNAADDRSLIFLSDGSPTHHSFSYNTAEALDIALARREKDFSSLPLSHQLNVNWLNFKAVVIRNAKETIPRGNFKSFKATYMHNDPCLRALVDKRDRLFQNLKYTTSESIRVEFSKTNAEFKRLYAAKSEHDGTKSAVKLMLELTTPSYGLLPDL
ncbi:RNA-directed DNA polymerase from mobile element jockey [Trichonephila clavipes]|nr:RNA-directed DNA polymerase from mobile element jockey [Trichonephila clavipes]